MKDYFKDTRLGLALILLSLIFGIGLGIGFGVAEDNFKNYITEGISAHPEVHDAKSQSKIWRYGQRAHFHATGIAAFSLSLTILIMLSNMKSSIKRISSTLVGLGSFYPLAWFNMYLLAPEIGRSAAHHHWVTVLLIYIGIGGLLMGTLAIILHVFTNLLSEIP